MTTTSNTPGPGEADREAVDWLILLQDDPDNQEDRERFEAWLAEDPDHAVAWADIQLTAGLIAMCALKKSGATTGIMPKPIEIATT